MRAMANTGTTTLARLRDEFSDFAALAKLVYRQYWLSSYPPSIRQNSKLLFGATTNIGISFRMSPA